MLALREHSEEVVHVPVRGGSTMELAWQLSWLANPSPVSLEAAVDFHSYGTRGAPMAAAASRPVHLGSGWVRSRGGGRAVTTGGGATRRADGGGARAAAAVSAASAELDVLPPSDAPGCGRW